MNPRDALECIAGQPLGFEFRGGLIQQTRGQCRCGA
jgi:hypothetical protein